MWSRLRYVWSTAPSGWRYAQIQHGPFILGARPSPRVPGYTGGRTFPSGSWLLWRPGATYADMAVLPGDFDNWLKAHNAP
jgi:hypothetical protein